MESSRNHMIKEDTTGKHMQDISFENTNGSEGSGVYNRRILCPTLREDINDTLRESWPLIAWSFTIAIIIHIFALCLSGTFTRAVSEYTSAISLALGWTDGSFVKHRWVPTAHEQRLIRQSMMGAVSKIEMQEEIVHIKPLYGGSEHNHNYLPETFHSNLHIGLLSADPQSELLPFARGRRSNQERLECNANRRDVSLLRELRNLSPKPLAIYNWTLEREETGAETGPLSALRGYVCSVSSESDGGLATVEAIKAKARAAGQVMIIKWFAMAYGDDETNRYGRNLSAVVQEVIPVRTGLQGLRLSAPCMIARD